MQEWKILNHVQMIFFVLLFLNHSLTQATPCKSQHKFSGHHARDWDDCFYDEHCWLPTGDDSYDNQEDEPEDKKNEQGYGDSVIHGDPGLSDDDEDADLD